jgi:ATP-dependent RNA helicase RhlE
LTSFQSLGLAEPLLRAVADTGYDTPTPIQRDAIPLALAGRDLTGCAQTGTGKTAAFVLPMLHRLLPAAPGGRRHVRALVVAPTRELALQVEESVRVYGAHTGLRSTAVFGGVNAGPQVTAFRRGVDIVIATPGRLLDHVQQGALDLSRVEILVLDEADRMFDMGFIRDVRRIVAAVPVKRQTLLFSATMPPPIQELAASIQVRPQLVEVGERRNPADTVAQRVCHVAGDKKLDLLIHLLDTEPVGPVLVFSRTKHRANRITKKLDQAGFDVAAIHSNRSQTQRQKALAAFKDGTVQILVATDIAARGIDVDGITHVVNFDTPGMPEDYIHRIGRTGRADATGDAITFTDPEEVSDLRDIERFTGRTLEVASFEGHTMSAPPLPVARPARPQRPQGGRSQGGRPQGGQGRQGQGRRRSA